jgi:predicted  nucleic acid-binding Zn-ribbon protein
MKELIDLIKYGLEKFGIGFLFIIFLMYLHLDSKKHEIKNTDIIKKEIVQVKEEVKKIKTDVRTVNSEISDMKINNTKTATKLEIMDYKITSINDDLEEIKKNNGIGFTTYNVKTYALLEDNDDEILNAKDEKNN